MPHQHHIFLVASIGRGDSIPYDEWRSVRLAVRDVILKNNYCVVDCVIHDDTVYIVIYIFVFLYYETCSVSHVLRPALRARVYRYCRSWALVPAAVLLVKVTMKVSSYFDLYKLTSVFLV